MPSVIIKAIEDNEILEPGDYPAVITKATLGLQQGGKHNGADKLDIYWRVAGRNTIKDGLIWAESLDWKLQRFVHACGLGKPGKKVELDAENVIGMSCVVTVTKEEVEVKDGGKRTVNRIATFKPGKVDDFLSDSE